jgi:hypothetical protein
MRRLKEAEGMCNAVDLKATLPEKVDQFNTLLVRSVLGKRPSLRYLPMKLFQSV